MRRTRWDALKKQIQDKIDYRRILIARALSLSQPTIEFEQSIGELNSILTMMSVLELKPASTIYDGNE